METERYRPSEAEIHAINQEALSASGPEYVSAPDILNAREAILRSFNVPEPPADTVRRPKSAKEGRLPSQMEVAMQKTDPSSTSVEALDAMVAQEENAEQVRAQEAERKAQFVTETAQIFFDKRWSQEISGETVDAMLRRNGIEPWTDQAAAFMAEWDRKQAEAAYDEAVRRFDGNIKASRAEIERLEKTQKSAATSSARTRAEKALEIQESLLHALESDRYAFVRGEGEAAAEPAGAQGSPQESQNKGVNPFDEKNWPPAAERYRPDEVVPGALPSFIASPDQERQTETIDFASAPAGADAKSAELKKTQKFARGQLIELPDGRRIRVAKKRLWRDKYYVEELNPDGTPKFRVDMEGDYLRQGTEVDEDSEESGGSAEEAPAEEERMAA
ncbi:MAG: hypothetical protein HYT31_05075 [Parcubacteria group bacterium]|nr:hypothetical protein [Parcubacteria group bacterium]